MMFILWHINFLLLLLFPYGLSLVSESYDELKNKCSKLLHSTVHCQSCFIRFGTIYSHFFLGWMCFKYNRFQLTKCQLKPAICIFSTNLLKTMYVSLATFSIQERFGIKSGLQWCSYVLFFITLDYWINVELCLLIYLNLSQGCTLF